MFTFFGLLGKSTKKNLKKNNCLLSLNHICFLILFVVQFRLLDLYLIIEILAVIFGLLYLGLLIMERIECWIFGILASLLSIFLFYHSKLYSEAILYSYYVIMGFYGYFLWQKKSDDNVLAINVNEQKPIFHFYYITICSLLAFALSLFFDVYTDAESPYIDAFTTVFSFLATYLQAKKVLSSWKYWIVINSVTIWLYINKELEIYAALMVVYLIMSISGYIRWKKVIG